MALHFTETEIEQLTLEKERLLQPISYFLKPLKNLSEFNEICGSMLFLQWEFFKSGIYFVGKTFSALGEFASSLLSFNFLLAGEKLYDAGKNVLIALEKLALILLFFLLHTIRLLTILIATFFPLIALLSITMTIAYLSFPLLGMGLLGTIALVGTLSVCGWIGGLCINSLYKERIMPFSRQRKQEWYELDQIIEAIFEERAQMIEALNHACQESDYMCENASAKTHYQFFDTNTNSLENQRDDSDAENFSQGLHDLVNGYPDFIAARATTEPDYIQNYISELELHHSQTKQVVEIYLGINQEVNHMRRSSLNLA